MDIYAAACWLFFPPMFPLGLPNIMVLREAIVRFTAPGGIERRRGPCDSGILVWTRRGNFGPVVKWVVRGSDSARVRGLISSWPVWVWITCFRKIMMTCWWLLSLSSAAGVEVTVKCFGSTFPCCEVISCVLFSCIIPINDGDYIFILCSTPFLSQHISSIALTSFIVILTHNLVTHHNVAAPTKGLHQYKAVIFWNANRAWCGIWNDDKHGIKDQFASLQPTLKTTTTTTTTTDCISKAQDTLRG